MAMPLTLALYELAVTNAERLSAFAHAAHGRRPTTLREDFSGTGALARAWLDRGDTLRAIAVDNDPAVTRHIPRHSRLRVLTVDAEGCRARADIIAATNFAAGYFHDRAGLVRYLKGVRASLARRGVFFCDMYGGEGSLTPSTQRVRVHSRGTSKVVPRSFSYEWQQVAADPGTNLVRNAIHFSWRERGRVRRVDNAFEYHWRLWSIPELRDAMGDAGFSRTEVYTRLADAFDHEGNAYVARAESVEASWVAYVVARK
ncbi:MAG: hypothetical protein U0637_12725 [Phycisphaerales bacterium]